MPSARRKLLVGNWKMNGLTADGLGSADELVRQASAARVSCDIILCPPATLITSVRAVLAGTGIHLGGQNCHQAERGPYTGEISAEMLRDAGCSYVIIGHAERRHGCGETNELIREKMKAAGRARLVPILCVGETDEQRQEGRRFAQTAILKQLIESMPQCSSSDEFVVAYEPVSNIGGGHVANISEIRSVHQMIHHQFLGALVLYGGSVTSENSSQVLRLDEVDGVLVGHASLNAAEFWAIAATFS